MKKYCLDALDYSWVVSYCFTERRERGKLIHGRNPIIKVCINGDKVFIALCMRNSLTNM